MAKDDPNVWFEPRRFGLGAGLPVAWQGWALLACYLAVVGALAATMTDRHPTLLAVLVVVLTIPLMAIAAQHTRGGWRWRWGGDE